MATYIVAKITIHDREEYGKYEAGFMEVFQRFEGEMLAVDEAPQVLEGSWDVTRTVLIRFPSHEAAYAWAQSDAYQAIAQHRYAAADSNVVFLTGLD